MPRVDGEASRAVSALPELWRHDAREYVTALDVSSNGERCTVGLGNGDVIGIALGSGREVFRFSAHAGGVLGVSSSPDGSCLVTCGQDASAKMWSASGDALRALPGGGTSWVEHVSWDPSGSRFATAAGRCLRVWSADGEHVLEAEPFPSTISGIAWSADGTSLAASCYGGVRIVPLAPGAKARHLPWKGSLISIAWSPDAKVIACGTQDAAVHFWRLESGQDAEMNGYPLKPKSIAWDSESKLLATAGDATVTVWDFRGRGPEGTRPLQLVGHRDICTRLAFSPRKGVLASGSQDGSVFLWEPRRSRAAFREASLASAVTALVWHPEHRALIAADAEGSIRAWAT